MKVLPIGRRYRLTSDLRLEIVPVTLDELRPHLWIPPEPDGVRVRDYGQRADIYYRNWREYRSIHRAAYYGKPIAGLRDVTQSHGHTTVDSVGGGVPLVSGYFAGTLDGFKLPAHQHRIGPPPSIVRLDSDEEDSE